VPCLRLRLAAAWPFVRPFVWPKPASFCRSVTRQDLFVLDSPCDLSRSPRPPPTLRPQVRPEPARAFVHWTGPCCPCEIAAAAISTISTTSTTTAGPQASAHPDVAAVAHQSDPPFPPPLRPPLRQRKRSLFSAFSCHGAKAFACITDASGGDHADGRVRRIPHGSREPRPSRSSVSKPAALRPTVDSPPLVSEDSDVSPMTTAQRRRTRSPAAAAAIVTAPTPPPAAPKVPTTSPAASRPAAPRAPPALMAPTATTSPLATTSSRQRHRRPRPRTKPGRIDPLTAASACLLASPDSRPSRPPMSWSGGRRSPRRHRRSRASSASPSRTSCRGVTRPGRQASRAPTARPTAAPTNPPTARPTRARTAALPGNSRCRPSASEASPASPWRQPSHASRASRSRMCCRGPIIRRSTISSTRGAGSDRFRPSASDSCEPRRPWTGRCHRQASRALERRRHLTKGKHLDFSFSVHPVELLPARRASSSDVASASLTKKERHP